jgi:lipid-binding SYLF domain-containing protein
MALWQKTKRSGKAGWDAAWDMFEKLGQPVNKLTNKIGSEAFWPTSLDRESDKAARILKSFCSTYTCLMLPAMLIHLAEDGFYTERDQPPDYDGPKQKAKVLVKIPSRVIQNCVGLAIFSTMRTGLWVSGSGGSGVLIAHNPDGTWSPPSGILVHTLGVGFNAGIDIYDCVVVINNPKALEAFSKLRVTLGGEVSMALGPLGLGGTLDANIDPRKEQNRTPVFTYMKSRGLYAGVQIDGTFIIERNDENARFYGQRMPVRDILAGRIKEVPASVVKLMEVAKSAEGRTDFDQKIVEEVGSYPAPGDVEVEKHMDATEDEKAEYGANDMVATEKEKEMEAYSETRAKAANDDGWEPYDATRYA